MAGGHSLSLVIQVAAKHHQQYDSSVQYEGEDKGRYSSYDYSGCATCSYR